MVHYELTRGKPITQDKNCAANDLVVSSIKWFENNGFQAREMLSYQVESHVNYFQKRNQSN